MGSRKLTNNFILRKVCDQTTDGTVVCHTGVIVSNGTINEFVQKPARAKVFILNTR